MSLVEPREAFDLAGSWPWHDITGIPRTTARGDLRKSSRRLTMRWMERALQALAAAGGGAAALVVRASPCEAAGGAPASTVRAEKSRIRLYSHASFSTR